jgi:hypothetical protein
MNVKRTTLALVTAVTLTATSILSAQVVQPSSQALASPRSSSFAASASQLPGLGKLRTFLGSSPSDTAAVQIVPAGQIEMEEVATVTEDMAIMARILKKVTGQPTSMAYGGFGRYENPFGAMFGGVQVNQSIYVQGFGALFTMKVGFPLSPGPDDEEQAAPEETKDDVDSVWLETRQALFDPTPADPMGGGQDEGPAYDAEKVEELKTSLINALKHAANIRALADGDVVVVTVTGKPVLDKIVSVETVPGTTDVVVVQKGGRAQVFQGGLPEDIVTSVPTVLTIRAKVSDINSYAKGTSTLEAFRAKVQVISHPQLGAGVGPTVSTSFNTGFSR